MSAVAVTTAHFFKQLFHSSCMAKVNVMISIEAEVLQELERRAKKELLPLQELIAEILRRSAVMSRMRKYGSGSAFAQGKSDDPFIEYFSRIGKAGGRARPKKTGTGEVRDEEGEVMEGEQNGI